MAERPAKYRQEIQQVSDFLMYLAATKALLDPEPAIKSFLTYCCES